MGEKPAKGYVITDFKPGDVVHISIPDTGAHGIGIERITDKAVFYFHGTGPNHAKEITHALFLWWIDQTVKATGQLLVDRVP